jgi:putative ABC transport system ATP-binding protein
MIAPRRPGWRFIRNLPYGTSERRPLFADFHAKIGSETMQDKANAPQNVSMTQHRTAVPDNAISLQDVDLSLGRGAARVHILKGISLDFARGEAVGLVGPSGSGKSTLLMTLAGLERPDSGKIIVDGTDLSGLDEDALARFRGRRIGIVFQSFHLIPTMTALENVALPMELAGSEEAFDRAEAELKAVGSRGACTIIRPSSRAASSSGWPLPAPSCRTPPSWSPTSPRETSTRTTGGSIVDLLFASDGIAARP